MNETVHSAIRANYARFVLITVMVVLILGLYQLDLLQLLTLESLQQRRATLTDYYHTYPYQSALYFFLMYILLTGLSLPVAGILMLASGAIFGLLWGTVIVGFSAATGSTLAFLSSRYLLHDFVQTRFSKQLVQINRGIEADGFFYLLLLRQVAVFPAFVLNLLMGLTAITTTRFYLASLIGMLPWAFILVNAGTQLATIQGTSDVLSLPLLLSLTIAGAFPLFARIIIRRIRIPASSRDTG